MGTIFHPKEMAFAPRLKDIQGLRPTPKQILLINPFYPKDPHGSFGKHVLTPSLALTSIAGVTPREWRVRYWDENLLQGAPPYKPFPEVVGISVHLTFARRAYELSQWYRRRGVKTILGGLHVQSCPEEAMPHADAIVVGNGLSVWAKILRDVECNKLKKRYWGGYTSDYALEPAPRRQILPHDGFLTTAGLVATRGCKNRCDFCYLSTAGLQMPRRVKPPAQVAREFQATGQPYGVFLDNNLGSDRGYLAALCEALRPLNKIWSAAISIDVAQKPNLVRQMAWAGCTGVFVGFESLNPSNLNDMQKHSPGPSTYAESARIFHNAGIQVNGSFVFGFDHDHKDVFEDTLQWIEFVKLECATFHILTPYPGTRLFQKLVAQNRLLHQDWDLYDTAHAVFQPTHMRPEELEAGYARCYRTLFSLPSIWHRRPAQTSAVLPYLMMSMLYKKSNRLWHFLIRHRLTHKIWRPIIEISRLRHLAWRNNIAQRHFALRHPIVQPGV